MRGTAWGKRASRLVRQKAYPRPEYIGTVVVITEPRRPVDTLELFPLRLFLLTRTGVFNPF